MEIPVLIEPISENRYRANNVLLGLSAEGPTYDEAFWRLEQLIKERMASGARVRTVDVPEEHPWAWFAGIFENEPLFDAWQEQIQRRRRELDEDPDVL